MLKCASFLWGSCYTVSCKVIVINNKLFCVYENPAFNKASDMVEVICVCTLRGTETWCRVVKLKETGNDMETLLLKAFKWLNATWHSDLLRREEFYLFFCAVSSSKGCVTCTHEHMWAQGAFVNTMSRGSV